MLAVFASSIDRKDPLSGLTVGEQPEPDPPHGWTVVNVKAASLNHHDLWSLRGIGLSEDRLPMILGCDAAGLDEDGNEVIVHSVISTGGRDISYTAAIDTIASAGSAACSYVRKPPGQKRTFVKPSCLALMRAQSSIAGETSTA